jgi:uncharacterized phiE125 gp8 family phage protein|tara:strand:+ start:172 stop:750 length:579 start_codon:yes stop_codon:yes gene_type:complete
MKYYELLSHHNLQIVTTSELKTHLRITFNDDDNYIVDLEKAAVRMVEEFTNLFLLRTNGEQYGNTFNDLKILFKSPLMEDAATSRVSYYQNGGWIVMPTIEREIVRAIKPSRVYATADFSNPTTDDVFQAWKINYNVGYNTIADIPQPLKQAIKIIVSDMYENRQSVIVGKIVSEIPRTAQYLMNPYKIQTL